MFGVLNIKFMGAVGDHPESLKPFGDHGNLVEPACDLNDVFSAADQDDVCAKIFEYTAIIITPDNHPCGMRPRTIKAIDKRQS